jgi:hypothetical protein
MNKPKKKKKSIKKNQEEEEIPEPPIEYKILKPALMPQLETLALDVVSIYKNIYSLEFPYLRVLEIRIYDAEKFNSVIIALANNML